MDADDPKSAFNESSTRRADSSGEQEDAYAGFRDLGIDEWHEWLSAFLAGDPRPPFVAATNEESHLILIRIFDNLEGKASNLFRLALFEVFETTPIISKNERPLYYLLHTLAYCVPLEAKQLLRRRLREGVFRRLKYGRQNLHNLLLVTCSKYHMDDEFAEYVKQSARASEDYDYLLLCQWVLSTRPNSDAYHLIERLLPLITSDEAASALSRQLITIGARLTYKDFLSWYRLRADHLAEAHQKQWPIFVKALQNRLLSDAALPVLARQDQDAVSLYAELRTSEDVIPLETVLAIARLHSHIGIDDTSAVLFDIWKVLYDRSGKVPWNYISENAKLGIVGTISRFVAGHMHEVKVPKFEPNTEKVLLQVKKEYEPHLPKIKSAGGLG